MRVTYEPAPGRHTRTQAVAVAPEPAEVRQPARTLTSAQQRALSLLTSFGARLSPDFTPHELRREYRLLARRIHPDRHATSTPAEREQLSRQFADLADSYRQLLTTTMSMN